ncbi:MAG TPA: SpoIIE family protein phosphatase [Vicinamibacteria bacterium]|nr:SpoIIE family protein phosphatase [Vicinamibacteria bacterium]
MIFQKGRLASQMLRWFLLIGLIPLFLATSLTYRNSVKSLEEEAYYELSSVANRQIKQIENYVLERQRDVTTLAQTPLTGEAIEELSRARERYGTESIEYGEIARSYRGFFSYYTESADYQDLFLISSEGDVLLTAAGGSELGESLENGELASSSLAYVFERASTFLETDISPFDFYPPYGEPAAFIAAPAFKDGVVVGAVALVLNNEDVFRIINDYTGLGRTGETVVGVINDGEIALIAPTRHDPDAASRRIPLDDPSARPLHDALRGGKGSGISIDYRGREVLAIWRYFPLRWGMVVKIDTEEAFAPVARLRNLSILITVLTLAAVVLTAQSVSRSLSEPIRRLTQYTQRISRGDLDQRIDLQVENEIGILASSFNRMTAQLKDSIRDLQETTAAQERIESELRVASDIQMSTMPKIFPPFPHRRDFGIHATIKPAREVGGDFFNFDLIEDDRLFFVIGDVSGKGVHAALFMAVANTLIQTAARAGLSPDEVLTAANRQLSRDNESCMFVTVFCGVVDLGSGRLTFSNGGHNLPYLLSDGDGVAPIEEACGLVLGLNPDYEYSSHSLTLRPGDGVFLYTDGVTEAMDQEGQMFGEPRVESLLGRYRQADAQKMVEGALEDVKVFAAGAPQSDDITLLALQYRPR